MSLASHDDNRMNVLACHAKISDQSSGVDAMPFDPTIPISVHRSMIWGNGSGGICTGTRSRLNVSSREGADAALNVFDREESAGGRGVAFSHASRCA